MHTNEDKASENKVLPIRELNNTFKKDADKILLSTIMILIKNAVERFIKRKKSIIFVDKDLECGVTFVYSFNIAIINSVLSL